MHWLTFVDVGVVTVGVALLVRAYFSRRQVARDLGHMAPVAVVIVERSVVALGEHGGSQNWKVPPQGSSEEAWVQVPLSDFEKYRVGETVHGLIYEHPSEGFLMHHEAPMGRAEYYRAYGVIALLVGLLIIPWVILSFFT